MDIDFSKVPHGATHYSEGIKGVYWPGYWKDARYGCWAFILDDREKPEWVFYDCAEIPDRAKRLPTSEKTAVQEREKAIREMCEIAGDHDAAVAACDRLYESGYRKQVQP